MDKELTLIPFHEHPLRDEWLANSEKLIEQIVRKSGKTWTENGFSKEAALTVWNQLAQGEEPYGLHAAVLNDSHILVFTFGTPWYAKGKWIIEQFFLRIGKGSSKDAFDAIDLLAAKLGASGVTMATSLASDDSALGRLLASHGYSPMSSQHFKGYN